ncbi:proline iminopeptidase-family hydrolase [Peribacillus kribbensis]|uniref:proline iminopeptidase-family hydrolase n=1 Tax=Peribacillus kribbensis TaxID=356658 RepID=UPI0003F5159D|nr:proline iminopeptidase-family hydrolase [Peribacillus kribbensis]
MNVTEGLVEVTGGNVWYRRIGEAKDQAPLLILHGGPGNSHLPLEALDPLAREREVIYYDQLGSGYSDRPDGEDLWTLDRFVLELGEVREALGLKEVHILGHSWGTTLLAAYLLTNPEGMKSAVFSSPCLSAPRWAEDQAVLLKELPAETQGTILKCEAEGLTDSKEYKAAIKEYYSRYVCRLDPWPGVMQKATKLSNSEIYQTMWGPSEFCVTGNLKEFNCVEDLHKIHVPSLFMCGRYDEAVPETTLHYSRQIQGAEFHVFEESSHTPYLEQTDEYLKVVGEFINQTEK